MQIKPHDEGSKQAIGRWREDETKAGKANGWQSTETGNAADRKVGQGTGKSGYVALLCVVGWQRELVATLWPRVEESWLCTEVARRVLAVRWNLVQDKTLAGRVAQSEPSLSHVGTAGPCGGQHGG